MDGRYMTVGEVADLLGLTVRSIQYYDQQGVLSPSAKGPQNQRLYTQEDAARLYEVVCLKYAGLPLAQIRGIMAGRAPSGSAGAAAVFEGAVRETEEGFSALLRRYETLRGLARAVKEAEASGGEPDWAALARTIESKRDEGRFFWRLSCVYDNDVAAEPAPAGAAAPEGLSAHRELVAAWHGVMADCVALMRSREPLDSPRSRAVARRVVELRAEDGRLPGGQGFLLIENAPPAHRAGGSSFDDLRQELNDYLDRLVEAYSTDAPAAVSGTEGEARP